jgi:hypothetical protein
MLAGAQGGEGLRRVLFIWRSNVDDIDFGRIDEAVVIVVEENVGNIPFRGNFAGAIRAGNRGNANSETMKGFDVNGTNKTGTDHASANLMDRTFDSHLS